MLVMFKTLIEKNVFQDLRKTKEVQTIDYASDKSYKLPGSECNANLRI